MQYELIGGSFPVVQCTLQPGESIKAEGGSMVWMDPTFNMETKAGGLGKIFGRALTGEGIFLNVYTATAAGSIAFGSSFPGKILPFNITPQQALIVQKKAFLASEPGVEMSVHANKSAGGALFGGEGIFMQKLSGTGMAFCEVDGELIEYDLAAGQSFIVDTGHVVGFTEGVSMEVQRVKGVKNMLFGGEGIFNTKLTGPGKIFVQTMSIAALAGVLQPFLKTDNA